MDMSKHAVTAACAFAILALAACGGEPKQAESPGTCPDGTVLRGADCVPPDSPGEKANTDEDHPAGNDGSGSSGSSGDKPPSGGGSDTGAAPAGGKVAYDKDAVESELKRAARQIKSNCGAATDDEGQATGPWGTTKASITLGRNGHIRQVAVPAPYDGKPAGICVVHAFDKIWFPPYAASSDVVVEWDIEIVEPKKH